MLRNILSLRLRVHTVLLSVPDIHNARQMLRQLQDIRLGAFHDVHADAVHQELLQLESLLHVLHRAPPLGANIRGASGAFLGGL